MDILQILRINLFVLPQLIQMNQLLKKNKQKHQPQFKKLLLKNVVVENQKIQLMVM